MKPIAVELRTRSKPATWLWGVAFAALLVGCAALVGAIVTVHQLDALRNEKAEVARAPQLPNDEPLSIGPSRLPYEASARDMLGEATLPWPPMLTALESAKASGISIVGVDLMMKDRIVRVEVQFSDYGALLKYLAELNAGESNTKWTLLQAQTDRAPMSASTAFIRGALE